jgi:hypothetical protein
VNIFVWPHNLLTAASSTAMKGTQKGTAATNQGIIVYKTISNTIQSHTLLI